MAIGEVTGSNPVGSPDNKINAEIPSAFYMETFVLTSKNYSQIIKIAIDFLSKGKLIVYPTETCYGLGADATNQQAIDQLLKFKSRREGKALSLAMADQVMAETYVELNETAQNLYQNFLPGPLTVVSRAHSVIKSRNKQIKHELAQGISSEFNTIGIRIPNYQFVIKLIKQFGKPITATSANVSYQPPPYSLQQWQKQTPLKAQKLIDLWIDAVELPNRLPSTVIDTTMDELTVLRQGKLQIDGTYYEYTTRSEDETYLLAEQVIANNKLGIKNYGLVIGLQGELGAGKTQFSKGIARALGINQTITSPTFTLINEYPIFSKSYQLIAKSYFYHIDTWRMESPQELQNIGFVKMLKPGNVIAIEWVEKAEDLVKNLALKHHLKLKLIKIEVIDEQTRKWQLFTKEKTK